MSKMKKETDPIDKSNLPPTPSGSSLSQDQVQKGEESSMLSSAALMKLKRSIFLISAVYTKISLQKCHNNGT